MSFKRSREDLTKSDSEDEPLVYSTVDVGRTDGDSDSQWAAWNRKKTCDASSVIVLPTTPKETQSFNIRLSAHMVHTR
ncbi:conserved hypothetical protein [Culex quinquefasciatus]|uniref:Uncharacterized protein n=1 Tax=Culex quinquefasciatus TaxID=7176 RepID=B0XBJ3_CULQU|nr:conserved hypothetical protein [Culex quinquefasciatus]|eukprot:XP_001867015.1 conserved hypothetical protein [Culex quinquefasciatus]